jgi:hypothetical protein
MQANIHSNCQIKQDAGCFSESSDSDDIFPRDEFFEGVHGFIIVSFGASHDSVFWTIQN